MLWPAHCVEDTKGLNFHELLEIAKTDVILKKGVNKQVEEYSIFANQGLN